MVTFLIYSWLIKEHNFYTFILYYAIWCYLVCRHEHTGTLDVFASSVWMHG